MSIAISICSCSMSQMDECRRWIRPHAVRDNTLGSTTGAVVSGTVSFDFNTSIKTFQQVFQTDVGGLIGTTFVIGTRHD